MIRNQAMLQPSLFEDTEDQDLHPAPYGIDQAGLALVPFLDAKADRTQPHTVHYQTVVDGKMRRVALTVRPGANLEIPSQHDQGILLSLLQLSHQRGDYEGLVVGRAEVLQALGWSDAGKSYQMLTAALHRLMGVTIEFESELLSRRGVAYQKHLNLSHLVDQVDIKDDRQLSITWGGLIRQAFDMGDFKRLDWQLALALPSPTALAFYRFLDRVVLSGETVYEIGWRTLATALGMSTEYHRPARFRQVIEPHIEHLVASGVIRSWEYQRGGKFVFQLTNYLRVQIRRVLGETGVYPEAARQIVSGYDELLIMRQVDQLVFRSVAAPGGYLVDAIRKGYDLRYPDDEAEAFAGLFSLLLSDERRAHLHFAERLTGCVHHGDPATWPLDLRVCIRFMVTHNLDPEKCK